MSVSSSPSSGPRITALHRLEYAAFRLLSWLANHLPIGWAEAISARLWRLIAPRLHRHPRAIKNLRAALPDLTQAECDHILDRMWDNLGRTLMEAFALPAIANDPEAVKFNATPETLALLYSDQPAVLISLHMGNWEMLALGAKKLGRPMMGVYQKILNPLVDEAVRETRQPFYRGGLHSKGAETVSRLRRGIAKGYSVGLMADLRDAHGEFVPFFGMEARSTVFPALLARLHKIPVIAFRAVRVGVRRFRIDAVEIDLVYDQDRKTEIFENTVRIQKQFEDWIREDPGLWMWGHRRWDFK